MKETNISAPDANITITDNTVEHIIYNTRTIKIDVPCKFTHLIFM